MKRITFTSEKPISVDLPGKVINFGGINGNYSTSKINEIREFQKLKIKTVPSKKSNKGTNNTGEIKS